MGQHIKHYSNADSLIIKGWEICWTPGRGRTSWGYEALNLIEGKSTIHYEFRTPWGTVDWKRVN